jgi:Rad3-related DNA helicase
MSFQLDSSVLDSCCEELETLHRHWLEIGEAEEILPDLQKLQDTVKLLKNLTSFLT